MKNDKIDWEEKYEEAKEVMYKGLIAVLFIAAFIAVFLLRLLTW